jgi:hypothetical protein
MRAVALVLVTGCSFVYNPANIDHSIDSNTSDVEVIADVDPTMLKLTDAWPTQVYEGAGTGRARPALVVIYGRQIAEDAVVTITPPAVKIVSTTIAGDHNFIALALEADDDGIDNDGTSEPLTIGVTQRGGTYSDVLDASKLSLVHLNALTTGAVTRPLYSQVMITGALAIAADATKPRLQLHAVGGISITGAVTANAAGATPGPGGCAGGAIGADGAAQNAAMQDCTGRGHAVAGGLNGAGGGGAGFVIKGDAAPTSGGDGGDAVPSMQLANLAVSVPAGGGGGAQSAGTGGSAGGGGGGSVEITAGGDISIPMGISANGGKAADVSGGGGGGGGAGGVILVRSGGTATLGTLSVARGEPGVKAMNALSGNPGGAGSVGRTRVDAANVTTSNYTGPMFVAPPVVSLDQVTTLVLRGAIGETTMTGQVIDRDGDTVSTFAPSFNGAGMTSSSTTQTLKAGYNRVCVTVAGGNAFTLPESTNCTEIAFLPH